MYDWLTAQWVLNPLVGQQLRLLTCFPQAGTILPSVPDLVNTGLPELQFHKFHQEFHLQPGVSPGKGLAHSLD